jgi:HEAT repeat protein
VRYAVVSTLGKLDAATLAQHAPAILARLEDSDSDVREAAVRTLGKLDAATLAQHGARDRRKARGLRFGCA